MSIRKRSCHVRHRRFPAARFPLSSSLTAYGSCRGRHPSPLSSGRKGSASASAFPRCSEGCTACFPFSFLKKPMNSLSSSQIQHTKSMYEIHSNNIKQSLLSFPYSLQHFKTTEIFHFIHGHKGIIKLPRDNKEGEHPGIL